MAHLLYVEASPRKDRSASIEVARAYLDAWTAARPGATVDRLDVWGEDLPAFDAEALEAKYAGIAGEALSGPQQEAWDRIRALAGRFHAADTLLFGVPMWNFGIPYRLKHLIDAVSQKDLLFAFGARGIEGLLGGRRMVVVAARGVAIGRETGLPAEEWEFQDRYMRMWATMVGIADVATVTVEQQLGGPGAEAASRAAARAEAAALAGRA